jgi:hypothetical protein
LSAAARHRVVIYRAGKAQQSFTFRFSDFKSSMPCLFLTIFTGGSALGAKTRAMVSVQVTVIIAVAKSP